jgi:hypothetical protein
MPPKGNAIIVCVSRCHDDMVPEFLHAVLPSEGCTRELLRNSTERYSGKPVEIFPPPP